MENHHRDGVRGADGLREGAGVDARVVPQGPHAQVGHDGHQGQHPYQAHAAEGILVAVQLVVLETVADVAVAVNGNAGDAEDGADDAHAHQESTDLAVQVAQAPPVVKHRDQHQGVRVNGPHQVGRGQAHHKHVS